MTTTVLLNVLSQIRRTGEPGQPMAKVSTDSSTGIVNSLDDKLPVDRVTGFKAGNMESYLADHR